MRAPSFALSLCLALAASRAVAQESPAEAARRALVDTAFALSNAGDHARALAVAEQAAALRTTPSLRLFLAEEHEHLASAAPAERHLVDGLAQAERCVAEATAQTAINNRARILHDCEALVSRLRGRVGTLTLTAPAGAAPRVWLDDRPVSADALGTAMRVSVGEHHIEALRDGDLPFTTTITLAAGDTRTVPVALAPVPRAPPPAPPPEVLAEPSARRVARALAWTSVGVGALSTVVGVVQWARSSSLRSDALDPSNVTGAAWARYATATGASNADALCNRASREAASNGDARTVDATCRTQSSLVATAWAFGAAGVALTAVGAVVAVMLPPSTTVRVAPVVAAGLGGAVVEVRF